MTESNINLLHLPLLHGLNEAELDFIRENNAVTFSFVKKGQNIVREGDKCESLTFIIQGDIICATESDDNSYRLEETLHAPMLIEPERLFGLSQRYCSTYSTTTACQLMTMPKSWVITMMEKSMIFRINLLNSLSTLCQKKVQQTWHQQSSDICRRIIRFIKDRCIYPAGQKALTIKMNDLARELGCSRLEVSDALHDLQSKELIRIHRMRIEIPMLELLLKAQ